MALLTLTSMTLHSWLCGRLAGTDKTNAISCSRLSLLLNFRLTSVTFKGRAFASDLTDRGNGPDKRSEGGGSGGGLAQPR